MPGSGPWHEPVLVAEVVRFLAPAPGVRIVDATVGTGGHAEALLARGARVIGIDRDPVALDRARERLRPYADRLQLLHGNFRDLATLVSPVPRVDGVLFDLGASSLQFDSPERGFSFLAAGPLDMRMDPTAPVTAADLVNRLPEAELARILWEYGEERYARRIARAIAEQRPLHTTTELARVVARLYPPGHHRIHPATRTFQALRIAVNDELGALETGLAGAVRLLPPGGALCVISFHSLEDRIVKHFLRREALAGRVEVLTKKPLRPEEDEVGRNPRARSAKLRAARVREVGPGLVSCP
ncbi:MAG TPA: 16S rRNA (cytosine(1402)-N(4))-methyltransferase RsmH [Candidatus Bipolaricaulis sp.]|nr:16S rRNA (cytosine(1402)-N(4))-methyltransferase RsmH [Candidatus Bipolaricaulis sp.]HRS13787.1 16S rRNA (cytosine(1402)-N(4))-methyltransferase RsmH [Candidatus Bipolaricaulis sp.]HRU21505.1 16S rRNA (cytosine(1402)-N(4))-methyltransferase RsmH [Candidatus Bipolaricaulis sp.]